MKLTIEVEMDNDAFADGASGAETARILTRLAERFDGCDIAAGDYTLGRIMDINGNVVGKWTVTPK